MPVTVIANPTNRGFPAAINQGLQVAHGEYLVLLNNDVVVTDAWLEQLVGLANVRTRWSSEEVEADKGGTSIERTCERPSRTASRGTAVER